MEQGMLAKWSTDVVSDGFKCILFDHERKYRISIFLLIFKSRMYQHKNKS